MSELPHSYLNFLASQIAFISTFLGGFAATILGAVALSDKTGKIITALLIGSAISASAFIVTVFAMTDIMISTTEGFPFPVPYGELESMNVKGMTSLLVGIVSLLFVIGCSGWLKSRKIGTITTIIGVISLILVFTILS